MATNQTKKPAGSRPPAKQPPKQQPTSGSYDESKHPRGAAGSGKGGQFVALSYSSSSKTGTGYGSKQGNADVRKLQEELRRLGVKDKNGKLLAADGKYGPLTTSAVMAAQRRLGLKADGKVTPALLRKITAAKSIPGVKTAHQQHTAHLAHEAHVMHLAHLKRIGKTPLKPKRPKKAKVPKFDGKPPLKPKPVKPMPWQRAGRPAPGNYRPPSDA